MKKYYILFIISNIIFISITRGQNSKTLKGVILDKETKTALAYANIIVLHHSSGTISNESGGFSIDISHLSDLDTLSFQYIGYKSKKIIISNLDSNNTIYLKEEIINLNEAFVFSDPPNAKFIIEQVIKNKERNYKTENAVKQSFIRSRNITDIKHIKINLKHNDIPVLNKKIIKTLENKLPKHNTSYTDFLGKIYTISNNDDSIKIIPTRTVSLKEKEITDLDQLTKIFTNLFKNTKENEYWKVKSGILSQKINIETSDSIKKEDSKSTNYYKIATEEYSNKFKNELDFTKMNDKDDWEFLYKTGRYNYELIGGSSISGESVYIIDFTPKNSGKYKGRIFISLDSYALIRTDYEYASGKIGQDIHLFGVGYTESNFSASVFFEKKNGNYTLKYFSKKKNINFSIDRSISLIKKRERFLFDKELYEIKVKFNITVDSQESIEFLYLKSKTINTKQFDAIKQASEMKIILVKQFDDKLWEGFPIIEPTKNMREYKKKEY